MKCLRCGNKMEKAFHTGIGMYAKCLSCAFRWTEEGDGKPMSYVRVWSGTLAWVDVPPGCLAVFSDISGV